MGEQWDEMHLKKAKCCGLRLSQQDIIKVSITTKNLPDTLTTTDVKCFKNGCSGMIKSAFRPDTEEIHWYCPDCENDGLINDWQGTKWDNR